MHVFVPGSANIMCRECTITLYTTSVHTVPTVPRDIKVSAVGPTTINVTWSAPANVNGILLQYTVYLAKKIGGKLVEN